MNRNLPVFVGSFLSGIFFIIGIIGTCFTGPKLLEWRDSISWPKAPAEILTGEIIYRNSQGGGRTARPHFTWTYQMNGVTYQGNGYSIAEITTRNVKHINKTMEAYPPGTKTTVFVNPNDPTHSFLEREIPSNLIVLLVPPFFSILGVIGGFFTLTGWLGWYRKDTRNLFGLLMRKLASVFMRPAVLITFLISTFALICIALVAWSIYEETYIGYIIAAFLIYSLWQASRFKPSRGRKRPL